MTAGSDSGMKPCGLGARDTCVWKRHDAPNGQDMDESVSPLEVPYAGLLMRRKNLSEVSRAQSETKIRHCEKNLSD